MCADVRGELETDACQRVVSGCQQLLTHAEIERGMRTRLSSERYARTSAERFS